MIVHRAEQGECRVVLTIRFNHPLPRLEEEALRHAEDQRFKPGQQALGQEVDITPDVLTIENLVLDIDGFIEVETADHPVDGPIAGRCQADLLGEGIDVCVVGVAGQQVSAGEV